jgi:3-hydroxyacyl-[acyl-carrier-protein] dehydratase
MQLNFEQVKKLLPQRYPYLMVDKVLELEPGKSIVAVKNVTGNEAYFSGHFPEIAIMPGTAIIEAMAQSVIIIVASNGGKKQSGKKKALYYLGSVKIRFYKPVYPGDQILVKANIDKLLEKGGYATAKVLVNEELVAEGHIVYSKK